ncbi:MAG: VWA domain-containing protein [Chloroflexi bacterium]|nr:MAG: VWA domain-containing protein [Chloroflexota bacterium]
MTDFSPSPFSEDERLRRWRLVLGGGETDGLNITLSGIDQRIDHSLKALYDSERKGGLGSSAPYVARWLGDIRSYFPAPVVRVLQKDALERLNLRQMLLEPEFLEAVEPDVHLVSTLISLKSVLPAKTKESAQRVVRQVVEELRRRLTNATRQAVLGALNKAGRNLRPRYNEIDWRQTIRLNLKHYQPAYQTIIPERVIGYPRQRSTSLPQRTIMLCIDQSGSMASSVVYTGIFGAVLASLRAIKTHVVAFDTSVVDLTEHLDDPVELLFSTQLGGGTDIHRALTYCQGLVQQPQDTILILISDLYEGGNSKEMLKRVGGLVQSGVQVIALLALSDDGRSAYHEENAAALAELGIPAFACTPDLFPDLMAAAIQRQDIRQWAAQNDLVTNRGK